VTTTHKMKLRNTILMATAISSPLISSNCVLTTVPTQ